jgi:hypothetical protein
MIVKAPEHRQNIDTLTTRNRKNRAVTSHL